MAFRSGDRVKETTTTTGTGDVSLAGAASGFQAFSAVAANGDQIAYAIVGTTEWEMGIGTWVTGNTLQRTYVESSSNAGALVNFSAGTKDVFNYLPAAHGLGVPAARLISVNTLIPPGTSLYVVGPLETAAGVVLEIGLGAVLEVG